MSARPTVVVTRGLPEGWLDPLFEHCEVVVGDLEPAGWQPKTRAALASAQGLLCMLTEPVDTTILDAAPKLRVVSNMAVGVDNIDVRACADRGIEVGHTPGVLTEATADLTWALLLAAARRLPEAATDAREGRWSTWSPTQWLGSDLHGATLGIVGLGAIGRAVARRAVGFGMHVLYTKRRPAPYDGAQQVELPELLRCSDFVSLHVPLDDDTRALIGRDALGRMKPTATLINTARGPIVDPEALGHALRTGQIRAAALDVTDPEPLPPQHELYGLPNCLIVPHIGSATEGTRRAMAALAVDNLLRGIRGEPLRHAATRPRKPQR